MASAATFTEYKREKFLQKLRTSGNVSASARVARVSRNMVYQRRKDDPGFAEAWDEAIDEAIDALEAEARRRAVQGEERKVYYQGKECGAIRSYSDQLLILLLKAHRPEKYGDRRLAEQDGAEGKERTNPILNITIGDHDVSYDERPAPKPAS